MALRLAVAVAAIIVPMVLRGLPVLALRGLSVLALGRVVPTPVLLVWRPRRGRLVRRWRVAVLLVLRGHGGGGPVIAGLLGIGRMLARARGRLVAVLGLMGILLVTGEQGTALARTGV